MTDKPDYTVHEWGTSLKLTPNGCPQEVVIACTHIPHVFSSVHYHEFKDNRIVVSTGELLVDVFPYGVSIDDKIHGSILYSDFHSILLKAGQDILIEAGMCHRICGIRKLTFITEIYTDPDIHSELLPPDENDIIRVIPAGQVWNGLMESCSEEN